MTIRIRNRRFKGEAILSPMDLSEAKQIGRRTFRKQILPLGSITYQGRKITFDKAFLMDLKKSFDAQAYDQVPLVLANDANGHNMDPERFRGEITGLEVTDNGLDAVIEATRQGARVIRDNPRLGVSARILHNIEKADGRTFSRALNHVLATMDPKVTKMSPWQTVDLSTDSNTEVVDLTAAHYTKEGSTMAKKSQAKAKVRKPSQRATTLTLTRGGTTHEVDLSELSDEEFQEILDLATPAVDEDEDEDVEDVTDELDDDEDDEDESEDDEEDDDSDEDEDEEDDEEEEDDDPDAELSNLANLKGLKTKGKKVLGKASGKDGKQAPEGLDAKVKGKVPPAFVTKRKSKTSVKADRLMSLSNRIAKNEWDRERRRLARAGVPPFMLDLAEPVLSQPDDLTLDLSNGEDEVNASEVIRGLLKATEGYLDIKPEMGSAVDLSEETISEADALAKAWTEEYGQA